MKTYKTNRNTSGAQSELLACAYFLELGYQVFRNVSSQGPADLVIWKPETHKIRFIDVTTGCWYQTKDGSMSLLSAARQKNRINKERAFSIEVLIVDEKGNCHMIGENS
mgnify:CR=1 FL=1